MAYLLAPDLSFCMLGDDPYFLDLGRNRYFRLDGGTRDAFIALMRNPELSRPETEALIKRRILKWTDRAERISPVFVQVPMRSLIEEAPAHSYGRKAHVLEIAFLLSRAWFERRFVPLAQVMGRRRVIALTTRSAGPAASRRHAGLFASVRRMIPIGPSCLPDSLALLDFLANRRCSARLVVGIRREPFAAHCWVQADDCLLNETVDVASGFTPIYVVP